MSDESRPGLLDRVVDGVASAFDALGLNGTRLRWKWNQRRRALAESGVRSEILWRSARTRHKMCPTCRALVERGASSCSECGADLSGVRAPGIGRLIANLLPGAGAATPMITLANGALFLLMLLAQARAGGGHGLGLFSAFDPELIVRYGSGASWLALHHGEWWRLITPIFLHGGILHFFFNSYLLLQLGPLVEEEYDAPRLWCAYLLCGIAGSVTTQVLHDGLGRGINTVGASGAICGLMGLLLVHGWRRGGLAGQTLKSMMLRYAVYLVILSLLWGRGIDHVNHAGGFACGLLVGLALSARRGPARAAGGAWQVASLAGVALVLAAFYHVAARA